MSPQPTPQPIASSLPLSALLPFFPQLLCEGPFAWGLRGKALTVLQLMVHHPVCDTPNQGNLDHPHAWWWRGIEYLDVVSSLDDGHIGELLIRIRRDQDKMQ